MSQDRDLFGRAAAAPPEDKKSTRRGPIIERLEELFRTTKFSCFTISELITRFPMDKPDAIRNAMRKLARAKVIRSTGAIKSLPAWARNDQQTDYVYYTLAIYKS